LTEFCIVLEDLTASPDYTLMPYAFGNQCWGMPEYAPEFDDPLQILTKFYEGIA
jgi:hypothetical protein